MKIQKNIFFSVATFIFLIVSGINATSVYFKNPSNATVTFSIAAGWVPSPFLLAPDSSAVTSVTLNPKDTVNKYVYRQLEIDEIKVNSNQPIKVVGNKGEVFFQGTKGTIDINIPKGQIWEMTVNDQ